MRLQRLLSGILKVGVCAGIWMIIGHAENVHAETVRAQMPFVVVDGVEYRDALIVSEEQELLASESFWKDVMGISVLKYPDSHILMQGKDTRVNLELGSARMVIGQRAAALKGAPREIQGQLYLPLEVADVAFEYSLQWQRGTPRIILTSGDRRPVSAEVRRRRMLPGKYDYRDVGRAPEVKDQGENGTCWSFASLTALETSGLPKWQRQYSVDHMSLHNSFSLKQEEGGEYTMSMAYLLAWQGPVLEEEDPYGDGFSPDGMIPSIHVQEIQILPRKNYDAIKEAVFLHGGVQSSLYTSMVNVDSQSVYYNKAEQAYCYIGSQLPNHDVVIVGWDDCYPKENFQIEVEGDGAFLCVNSWGEAFGDEGYFYVSYYDKYIGDTNLVYTGVNRVDSEDRIYQTDLCGWVGQIGYGREMAYGANVYVAEEYELLEAAGFYAVGEDTTYQIYVDTGMETVPDFTGKQLVAEGTVKNSGYYTIEFDKPVELQPGQRFAVILRVVTPGAVHPLAVEYPADDATRYVDLSDGEGYISAAGAGWEDLEETHGCNLCLKAYTRLKND